MKATRPRLPILRVLPALVLAISAAGCGASEPEGDGEKDTLLQSGTQPDLTTPEATLEAAKAASAAHDAPKLCQYFTPQAQETLAASAVALSRLMVSTSGKGNGPAAGEDGPQTELVNALRELLETNNLTDETLPKIHIDGDADEEEQLREVRKLAAPIEDHCAFFADFMRVLRKHGNNPEGRLIEENAHLEDLTIDGDTAKATFVQSRDGRETRDEIEFRRLDGQWKISRVPALFN